MFLASACVQDELGFTEAQRRVLQAMLVAGKTDGALSATMSEEERQQFLAKRRATTEMLAGLFSPPRSDRLCEIIAQVYGPGSYLGQFERERVMAYFDLSRAQMEEVEKLLHELTEALADRGNGASGNEDDYADRFQEETDRFGTRLRAIFTPAQLEKLSVLEGKPVDVVRIREDVERYNAERDGSP